MTGLRFFGIVHTGYSKNQGYAPWRPMVDIAADHSMVPNVLANCYATSGNPYRGTSDLSKLLWLNQ